MTNFSRLKFREQKQCKPFKWYLEHVYPQKFILDSDEHVFAYGRVRNEPSGLCIDTLQHDDKDTYNVGVYSCHAMVTSSQFFSFRYESHFLRHTIRKVKFLSKNSILTKPKHFHDFFIQIFLTIFLVKSKLSTAKKYKTTTFSRVFHPKKLTIFSENQS